MSAFDPGDQLEYGISMEIAPGLWAKSSVTVRVREDETPLACFQRASGVVDGLLRHHAKELLGNQDASTAG